MHQEPETFLPLHGKNHANKMSVKNIMKRSEIFPSRNESFLESSRLKLNSKKSDHSTVLQGHSKKPSDLSNFN